MNDGLKLEYTEGCATFSMHLRTNNIGPWERVRIEAFIKLCNQLFDIDEADEPHSQDVEARDE